MWDRKKLKEIAKEKFQANYWKCVLVALLFSFIMGGASGGFSGGGNSFGDSLKKSGSAFPAYNNIKDSSDSGYDDDEDLFDEDDPDDAKVKAAYDSELGKDVRGAIKDADEAKEAIDQLKNKFDEIEPGEMAAFIVVIVFILAIISLIVLAIGILFDALLINPIEIGCAKFFYKNLSEPANVSNVTCGFDHGYKNNVKIMLWRDVYTFLWSLLFIIPGIIKSYEYKMIPYLLAENPEMTKEEAFAESKRMMDGQKWNAFVLDLSFIGWDILSGLFTAGLLSVFFVAPYKRSAQAALYDALKYGQNNDFVSEVVPM